MLVDHVPKCVAHPRLVHCPITHPQARLVVGGDVWSVEVFVGEIEQVYSVEAFGRGTFSLECPRRLRRMEEFGGDGQNDGWIRWPRRFRHGGGR